MRHLDNFPWMMFWMMLTVVVIVSPAASQTCSSGWFGENCQYKCHQTNGGCTGDCVPGWFGTDCQYADLMYTHGTTSSPLALRDGDSSTCVADQNLQSVTLSLTKTFSFTWMRLTSINDDLDLLLRLNVQLQDSNGQNVTCNNMRKIPYNDKVLDVYCDGDVAVQTFTLSGDGVKSLCDVFYSGGRNIALKQRATQSSTYSSAYASLSVDGNTVQNYDSKSCSHTSDEGDSAPYWRVDFSHPRMVNRYVIYNRLDYGPERLKGFILTSYTEDNRQVFRYQDTQTQAQSVYTVTSVGVTTPVSYVVIRATKRRSGDDALMLTMCEVEIYGDCPHPTYGLDCQETCSTNCVDQRCNLQNGICQQCPSGRIGDQCDQDCPQSYCGQDCLERCSINCVDQVCDSVTGVCHQCPPGKTGDSCGQDCPHPTYGQDCEQTCSTNCVDQRCNVENGICEECSPGWIGDYCDQGQQVAFSVQLTQTQTVHAGDRVVYDRIVTNVGEGYDAQTGIFTCPVAGLYVFLVEVLSDQRSNTKLELDLNDTYVVSISGAKRIREAGGNTAILSLAVNDTVDVKATAESKLYGEPEEYYATFSGFLIPQTYKSH